MEKHPKVLVGCPTSDYHEYALQQYADSIKKLTYKNHDILLVDNSKDNIYFEKIKSLGINVIKGPWFESARERIIASRNILRQKVLDEGYDYFLSLEQDVLPPLDIIERLLNAKKRVISGIYFTAVTINNETRILPVIWSKISGEYRHVMQLEELNKGVKLVAVTGLGCVLIHRLVLKDIKFRYEEQYPAFDDIYFGLDCKGKKINIYADTNLICKHLIKDRPWKWNKIKN